MTNQITNAAPMVIDQGTEDLSKVLTPRTPVAVPQHLPKFFTFAAKNDDKPVLVSGVDLENVFGKETFDVRGRFATPATVFINGCNSMSNAMMLQRLIPEDAGPESTLIAWLDVLETMVDDYERNIDGSIKTDVATGDPIIVGTIAGYKCKWVVTHYATEAEAESFGALSIVAGDQTDTNTNTQSSRYPIFELKASSKGSLGNFSGIRLSAPNIKTATAMPNKMMSTAFAYPYNIQMIQKPDAISSPKVTPSIYNDQSIAFTFKEGVKDPLTGQDLGAEDIVIQSYENLTDVRYAKIYGAFHGFKVYNENIDLLVKKFQAAEVPFLDQFSDFTADPQQAHLFNFVTGSSSFGVPYHSFIFVDSQNTTRWSESTNVYAAGGSDGTMNNATFNRLVAKAMDDYADPMSPVQEMAVNVESIFYDVGYDNAAKEALCKGISTRLDTFVVLSPFDASDRVLTASEESSVGIALRTRLQSYPESDYFGTPVSRGMIVGRSGKIRNSLHKKETPMTYEVMMKAAKYMGAANGRWKNGANFDGAPGSILEFMTDINITWVPASVRNRNWDIGLMWINAYDTTSYFIPAFKTVYDDDTSVLNSFTCAMAICQLNKIAHAAWREFSGVDHLTDAQFVKNVNDYVNGRVANIFDSRFIIIPDAQITDRDAQRGFSWTLPIKIGAPSLKTVMTTHVQAYRFADLAAQSA